MQGADRNEKADTAFSLIASLPVATCQSLGV